MEAVAGSGSAGQAAVAGEESPGTEQTVARLVGAFAAEAEYDLLVHRAEEEDRMSSREEEDSVVHSSAVRSRAKAVEGADRLRAWSFEKHE